MVATVYYFYFFFKWGSDGFINGKSIFLYKFLKNLRVLMKIWKFEYFLKPFSKFRGVFGILK